MLLCVHTQYNLFAHSSCTSLFILIFIKSTVDCIAHFSSLHILLLILFYFLLIFYLIPTYIYIYSPVLCSIFYLIFLHCPLSGPVLTYISLLIIPCMIVYVTNKQEPWTLNLQVNDSLFNFVVILFCVHLLLPFVLFTLIITVYRLIHSDIISQIFSSYNI